VAFPEVWTDEQIARFRKEWDEAFGGATLARHQIRLLPPGRQDLDAKAAAFAKAHGSFALLFDAGQNYVRPDDCPWTLQLDSDTDRGWGGFTAGEAIDFAAAELSPQETAHG
jgi:hypothetical protein